MSFFPAPNFRKTNRDLSIKEWRDLGLAALRELPPSVGIFETFRIALSQKGFPEPPDDHWWPGLSQAAEAKGIIKKTGDFGHMKLKKSNGRLSPVYSINGG